MRRHLNTWALILGVAAVYVAFGKLALASSVFPASASTFWPASGVALAALLLGGERLWPAICIGSFVANLNGQGAMIFATGIAAGNTLAAVIAARLVRRFANSARFHEHVRPIFKFVVFAALLSPLVSAACGALSLCFSGKVLWEQFGSLFALWWLRDLTSNLILTPAVVMWFGRPPPRMGWKRALEAVSLIVVTLVISAIVFFAEKPFPAARQLEYLVLPPILWAALRLRVRGAVTAAFLISAIAWWSTLRGAGPFAHDTPAESLVLLQTFMATVTLIALVLASALQERRTAERHLMIQDAVSRILSESTEFGEAVSRVLEKFCELGEWDIGSRWIMGEGDGELRCAEVWRARPDGLNEFVRVTRESVVMPGGNLLGRAWADGQPVWISDARRVKDFARRAVAAREGLRSGFCFPFVLNGETVGAIECFSREGRLEDESFLRLAVNIGAQVGQFIERKRAEAMSRESEVLFRQVTENIQEVFWITDVEKTRMIYVSPGYEKIWGRSCGSLYRSPRSWVEALHEDDRERILDASLTKQAAGEYNEVYRILRPDDSVRWVHDRAFPILDATGKVTRVFGIVEDVTAERESQKNLRESEKRFRTLFQSAPIGIAVHDAAGKYVQTNRAYQQMLGYSAEDLLLVGVRGVTYPDDIDEGRELFEQIRAGKREFYKREKRYVRADGQIVWATSSASAVRDANGELDYIISMVEDITERKRVEEVRAQYAAIVEFSDAAIIGRTESGLVTSWNPGAEKIFGYTAAEMVGKTMQPLLPRDRVHEEAQLLERLKRGEHIEHFESNRLRKDGIPIDVSVTLSPIQNGAGRVVGISEILRDITDWKRLQKAVLEVSDREQRRIGQDIHDNLCQYLFNVAMNCNLLKQDLVSKSAPEAGAAAKILAQVESAISEARALASGLSPLNVIKGGLAPMLQDLATTTRRDFRIECVTECPEEITVHDPAVAMHLYRIAKEAVHNAVKHALPKRITIRWQDGNGKCSLSIRDDGVGLSNAKKSKSGMGLDMMRYRANAIGGELKIEEVPVGGTLISCNFPAAPV